MTFTLTLTLLAMTGGIIFGTLLAMMRLSAFKPLSMLAGGYVNLMRSMPLVLVIFWFFFLVPYIGAWITGATRPIQVGAFCRRSSPSRCSRRRTTARSCAPASSRSRAARCAAGYALGLNYWQTMGYIVLPQAFRNMLPVLLTQTIILFQDTSLVYVHLGHRLPRRGVEGRASATTAWSRCTCSPPWSTSSSRFGLSILVRAPAAADRHHPLSEPCP